jgi:hypothetical protein
MAVFPMVRGGTGSSDVTLKFTCHLCRVRSYNSSNNGQAYVALETENISHFTSAYNSELSGSYADESNYLVGYADTIPSGFDPFASSGLTNTTPLNGANFDVDKTKKYLVLCCSGTTSYGRIYDVELTLG